MINRRDFVVAGVTAGGTAAIMYNLLAVDATTPLTAVAQDTALPQLIIKSGIGPQMDEFLLSLEHTDTLGRAWLGTHDKNIALTELAKTVAKRIDTNAVDIAAATAARVRQDFAQETLCELDGWRLSLTECQVAALRVLAIDANPANEEILAAREKASLRDSLSVGTIATLKNWGPKKTLQGVKFNEQADGHCGLWFQIEGAPAHAKIMIDGEVARTTIKPKVVTSGLFGEQQEHILSTPGKYEIALIDPIKKIKQPIGEFEVQENPSHQGVDSTAAKGSACAVSKWGPKRTKVGVAKNEQPDGAMGVWVHVNCLPDNAKLLFGDDPLHITKKKFGFTTSIPLALIETPGTIPLRLTTPDKSLDLLIGEIVIEE